MSASLQTFPGDKFKERILLLRRFLPHLEWTWPNEIRTKISKKLFDGTLPIDQSVSLEKLAKTEKRGVCGGCLLVHGNAHISRGIEVSAKDLPNRIG